MNMPGKASCLSWHLRSHHKSAKRKEKAPEVEAARGKGLEAGEPSPLQYEQNV